MTPDIRKQIRALGCNLTPDMMKGTQRIFAASYGGCAADTVISRDHQYGSDERHRLDIFHKADTRDAPVLVYVHGGGFVMGDKRSDDWPFYDNVGDFAARHGMVGVTVTYRLAPAHRWPSGPEDMASIVTWLHENIAEFGGDPARIFLMGQSAGAVHVASYLAHSCFHGTGGVGIAGALLLSCIYDIANADANAFHQAYFGEDETAYPACSSAQGLIESSVPWMASLAEFDVPDFQKQAGHFVSRHVEQTGRYPPIHYLSGHNHLSPALEIGSPGATLEPVILDFIASQTV